MSVVGRFGFGGGAHTDGGVQTAVIPPVDVLEQGVFELLDGAPWAVPVDQFGFELADGGLGQGVVVAVADRSDGGQRTGAGQGVGVADRGVLTAGVAVMDQPVEEVVTAAQIAISRASSGRSVRMWVVSAQPTSRREYTSMTSAR